MFNTPIHNIRSTISNKRYPTALARDTPHHYQGLPVLVWWWAAALSSDTERARESEGERERARESERERERARETDRQSHRERRSVESVINVQYTNKRYPINNIE